MRTLTEEKLVKAKTASAVVWRIQLSLLKQDLLVTFTYLTQHQIENPHVLGVQTESRC